MDNVVLCPFCGKENELRNYYCRYCRKLLKDISNSKKFGYRGKRLFKIESISDDKEEVIHVNGFTPYESKINRKGKDEV